jgi:O-antigen/teichoic acid export membrane protein
VLVKALGREEYGVWVTLQSLVIWVALLELGLGKGLRTKVIESLNQGINETARQYISSSLFGQLVLWGGMACLLFVIVFFGEFPWAQWFRSNSTDRQIGLAVLFSFLCFLLTQISGVIHAVLYAKHWNAATALVGFFSSLGLFLYAWISSRFEWSLSIPKLALANLILFALGYSIQAGYLFRSFPELIPSWRVANRAAFSEVLNIGIRFLVIEVAYVVIFIMDRWIVLQVLGPAAVTEYDILLRISALITTGYTLFIGPIWALAGTAWGKRDLAMMDKLWKIVSGLMVPFALASILIGLMLNPLIHMWVDRTITIPPIARWSMVIYSWVVVWGAGYASLLNGIGRTREQVACCAIACLINIPLGVYLCSKTNLGIAGVIVASTFSLSIFNVVAPFVWLDCRQHCKRV